MQQSGIYIEVKKRDVVSDVPVPVRDAKKVKEGNRTKFNTKQNTLVRFRRIC